MTARTALALMMAALAVFARIAGAEMRLDVDEELRQAEAFREHEAQRHQRTGESQTRIQIDPDQDLRLLERGARPPTYIPDARYRVAVFTFEDPDKTGLGNALAGIVGREILLKSNVGSIGVLRYEGSLAPSPTQPLSYFDKVELLAETQEVTLAVWGMVRRTGDAVSVDIYAQLPPRVVDESFSWSLRLPAAMGGGKLLAHLRPARMLIQRQQMGLAEAESLPTVVRALDTLRADPNDNAATVATLPTGSVYWVNRREGDWIEISTGAAKGWVRSAGHCVGGCGPLLDGARFAAGLLQFMKSRRIPDVAATLAPDAAAVRAQLSALEQLDTARPGQFQNGVWLPLTRWLPSGPHSTATPPGGAAFANIRALAQVATSLQAAMPRSDAPLATRFDSVKLAQSRVREIAFELAGSSLTDPRNTDVLANLAVLFRYAGDEQRAGLAARLAAGATRDR